MNKRNIFIALICLISIGAYIVNDYYNDQAIKDDKRVITNAFNETVTLQNAIVACYKKTNNLENCNSGKNDIPYPVMDSNKGISIYNGSITIAFVSSEMSKILHGGYVVLSLDTTTAHDNKPKWNCTFANVNAEKINMDLLPSLADCKFKK